jgi:hypothetical protein
MRAVRRCPETGWKNWRLELLAAPGSCGGNDSAGLFELGHVELAQFRE